MRALVVFHCMFVDVLPPMCMKIHRMMNNDVGCLTENLIEAVFDEN